MLTWLLVCSALLAPAVADLNTFLWPSTAFAPPSACNTGVVPAVNYTNAFVDNVSFRLTGTVANYNNETITFSLITDGAAFLWVDDHLAIDAGGSVNDQRKISGQVNISFAIKPVQTFRLEYIHQTGPSALQLYWEGNTTAYSLVPASAFTAEVTPFEQQRVALKERMLNPAVQWQTYYNPSMGTHVRMPQSLALESTLATVSNGKVTGLLGNIIVFRQSHPALTLVGPHSYNGSDYTELLVEQWNGMACSVLLQTTVMNGGADLVYLATSNGSQCAGLGLSVTPPCCGSAWGRSV